MNGLMAVCEFGDIVVVPFPFVDRPTVKRRPALVLTNANFNAQSENTVLAMITTGANSTWPSDIPLADLEGTGLDHPSVIRWKLFTLPNELILRRAGHADTGTLQSVKTAISTHFSGSA